MLLVPQVSACNRLMLADLKIGQFSSAVHYAHQSRYMNDGRMEDLISSLLISRLLHLLSSTTPLSRTYSIGIELACVWRYRDVDVRQSVGRRRASPIHSRSRTGFCCLMRRRVLKYRGRWENGRDITKGNLNTRLVEDQWLRGIGYRAWSLCGKFDRDFYLCTRG